MKGPAELVADVARHLRANWHLETVSRASGGGTTWWPRTYSLGLPRTQAELEASFTEIAEQSDLVREWARRQGLGVEERLRRVFTSTQTLTTGVVVDSVETAATVAGTEWVDRLGRGCDRAVVLAALLPHLGVSMHDGSFRGSGHAVCVRAGSAGSRTLRGSLIIGRFS